MPPKSSHLFIEVFLGLSPFPVIVTTRIITFLVGNPNLNLHFHYYWEGGPPKVFPYFHHPFWGFSQYFWEAPKKTIQSIHKSLKVDPIIQSPGFSWVLNQPKIGGKNHPKWMVYCIIYNGSNPMNKWDDLGGKTPLFLVQHPFGEMIQLDLYFSDWLNHQPVILYTPTKKKHFNK